MKGISLWGRGLLVLLVVALGSVLWAWLDQDLSTSTISRGFFVGGALAILLGFGNLGTSSSMAAANAPSYSTANYATLGDRIRLMFSDMAEHSKWSVILTGGGLLCLVAGFLVLRFG